MIKYFSNPKIYIVVTGIMIVVALQIAWQTRYRAHPDEITHGNGFCYFETHSWIPNLNSDDVFYDPYGWNRVYDAEIVYLFYGKLVGAIRPFAEPLLRVIKPKQFDSPGCEPAIEFYRWLNISLYAITLWMVFRVARHTPWVFSIAAVLLCIPQVIYIYSYANDDAWGLSFSIFLFLYIASCTAKPRLTIRDMIYVGILIGIVLVSKKNYWISIPFSYALFLPRIKRALATKNFMTREFLAQISILVISALAVAAPLLIIYPLTQGNFAEKIEQMNEQRARSEFKPGAISAPGYRMASRGVPFQTVLKNYEWYSFSARSFYGLFSYFTVVLPSEIYRFAAGVMLFLLAITCITTTRFWQKLPEQMCWLLILAPVFFALNIFLSLYNSWMYDYQSQGRYLFPSLVPFAIMLGGTMDIEQGRTRWLQIILWAILYGLCVYVLWTQVVQNPTLR